MVKGISHTTPSAHTDMSGERTQATTAVLKRAVFKVAVLHNLGFGTGPCMFVACSVRHGHRRRQACT